MTKRRRRRRRITVWDTDDDILMIYLGSSDWLIGSQML